MQSGYHNWVDLSHQETIVMIECIYERTIETAF
jgi:hypothetical protein